MRILLTLSLSLSLSLCLEDNRPTLDSEKQLAGSDHVQYSAKETVLRSLRDPSNSKRFTCCFFERRCLDQGIGRTVCAAGQLRFYYRSSKLLRLRYAEWLAFVGCARILGFGNVPTWDSKRELAGLGDVHCSAKESRFQSSRTKRPGARREGVADDLSISLAFLRPKTELFRIADDHSNVGQWGG
ncbi:hypothetical protein B0O80DRAFT_3893 [Mortierella sp. GBAus27b]|nr:hypothetical protein B0O80DRAFT_3893 [Mortierella sp. GBAus27b]